MVIIKDNQPWKIASSLLSPFFYCSQGRESLPPGTYVSERRGNCYSLLLCFT